MIYVRLHGRLGNQLFEYAAARGLAHLLSTDVAVDERMLARKGHSPARQHFNWRVVTPQTLPPDRHGAPLRYAIWRFLGNKPRFLREDAQSANTLLDAADDTYLHGYWQRPHYFAHIENELREELCFATPPTGENARLARLIRARPSVSVHVRRGDFVGLGLATPDTFYRRALERLAEISGALPHVYFFSDDPNWVRESLAGGYDCTVVDHNGPEADFEDLRLISLCQNNIISPSSFSWWGAWLNRNPDKVVIGPGDPGKQRDDSTSWYPSRWHVIKAD